MSFFEPLSGQIATKLAKTSFATLKLNDLSFQGLVYHFFILGVYIMQNFFK